ncbi:MAG TPA: GTP-binding protein [Cytophagales bacterium]|nr:GTP-binding protein [Cytophagales bacterium]HAA23436.1 GTP-binding protein [Cytophagales bacterium]HAP58631.1 GTP-binding protein [Cytophagales bacterium]
MTSKKIILLGFYGVGKTSLVSQFVYKKFSDRYLTTIGVSIEKKVVEVAGRTLNMIIWDVAGESSLAKVFQPYLAGSHGGLYVFDLSRRETYENIKEELELVQKAIGKQVPIKVIGNKADLMTEEEIYSIVNFLPITCDFVTSAKTSHNVELAFQSIGQAVLAHEF